MLDWVQSYGHWGYIYAACAVTLVLLLADLLPPWLRQRQLRAQLAARLRRESAHAESKVDAPPPPVA